MYILPDSTSILTSSTPLTVREGFSGALGCISIASWVFLLIPQLVENYRNQSAEAISFAFISIWLVGDFSNLLGGFWAGLVPTAIALSIFYCIQDTILICQTLYYGIRNRRREGKTWLSAARQSMSGGASSEATVAVARVQRQQNETTGDEPQSDEEQPLLKRTASASARRGNTDNLTAAERRTFTNNEMARRRSSLANDSHLVKILEVRDSMSGTRRWLTNIVAIIGVFVVGTAAWAIAYRSGAWTPTPLHDDSSDEPIAKGAQILGYISALAYLSARIPQIIKNYREQSCEGLSLLFFIFSLLGNLTYGMSLLFHSTERTYVIKNIPWLLGSLGTMAEDATIFTQFYMYGSNNNEEAVD